MDRKLIINKYYLRITDIMQLMQVGRCKAKIMFSRAKELEQKEFDNEPIYDKKVEFPCFVKANNINLRVLKNQIDYLD